MPNDPSYVRLANRLALQMVADVTGGSGWSIAGLDVKEFPEDEDQAAYVRVQLGRGVLEPASQSEYDEVHEEDEAAEVVSRFSDPTKPKPWQEAEVQQAHAKKRRALEQSRSQNGDDDDELSEEEEDEQRRQAIAEEQEELGLNTDDPEEQVSRVRSGGVRAKKSQSAKKKTRQRQQASEPSE